MIAPVRHGEGEPPLQRPDVRQVPEGDLDGAKEIVRRLIIPVEDLHPQAAQLLTHLVGSVAIVSLAGGAILSIAIAS